jgi:hypothetical protein
MGDVLVLKAESLTTRIGLLSTVSEFGHRNNRGYQD